jgi:predicted HTH transcriptional regulator
MPESDLSELVAGRSEDLGVEYKAWMDTSQPEVRAKLARHIAALANHGGGYLIFGVDDTTRQPQGATKLDQALFSQDAISAIVKRYLEPRIQIRVDHAEHGGVPYPVVIVPSHSARPVIAVADGPQDDKGRPVGIRQGEIYIRAAGPESVQIKHADDWNTLLERCLSHRSDLLGKILRQSIAKPTQPSTQSRDLLRCCGRRNRAGLHHADGSSCRARTGGASPYMRSRPAVRRARLHAP